MIVADFLADVYAFAAAGDIVGATDVIFNQIDRAIGLGNIDQCNQAMAQADIDLLPPSLLRSFLVWTWRDRAKLPARKKFYRDAHTRVTKLIGVEQANRLLHKLEGDV